ncbi:hypothetical protein GCM10010359_55570 [Streptomyces morookaense]|nr:hypothetical protein GCM10010359_55570 [Streptomyces morookaense]
MEARAVKENLQVSTATLSRSNTRLREAALTVCGPREGKTAACASCLRKADAALHLAAGPRPEHGSPAADRGHHLRLRQRRGMRRLLGQGHGTAAPTALMTGTLATPRPGWAVIQCVGVRAASSHAWGLR